MARAMSAARCCSGEADLGIGILLGLNADHGRVAVRCNGRKGAITTAKAYRGTRTIAIGDLLNDFDFRRQPIPPLVLSDHVPD
jgi:hypothetical protein